MNVNFDTSLKKTLSFEGGYSNHPLDNGGATNFGITHTVYDNYRAKHNLPREDVKNILGDEVSDIYKSFYWDACSCELLPSPLDSNIFDCAVNCGVSRAVKLLQSCLGVADDGIIGHNTTNALQNRDVKELNNQYVQSRIDFYNAIVHNNPTQCVFLKGWLNRAKLFLYV